MNGSQMLTDEISDARAWQTSTVDGPEGWYYSLSENCLSSLDQSIRGVQDESQATTEISRLGGPNQRLRRIPSIRT